MNYNWLISDLEIDKKSLDIKKEQTDYKIKYVIDYVKRWLLVSVNRQELKEITFIDCMCNFGIYADGDLCTAMEVFILFLHEAEKHPCISFNLLVNDVEEDRIEIFKRISEKLNSNGISNVHIYLNNEDVNDYLNNYSLFDRFITYPNTALLFVDPYDFGTVVIRNLTEFIIKYYCEVIFNFFISDYVRNGIDKRISACIGNIMIADKEELISYIRSSLKVGKVKHVFSYKFKTKTNTELYQIIFVTPHPKGLEKLKEALWDVFNGKFAHRNSGPDTGQISLFDDRDEREQLTDMHACEAKQLLIKHFTGKKVSYPEIEIFVMEYTMMMPSQIIKHVLRPLIEDKKMQKCGNVKVKSNYKADSYVFFAEDHAL